MTKSKSKPNTLQVIRCVECALWEFNKSSNTGLCRRYAPKPIIMEGNATIATIIVVPSTNSADGCADGVLRE